MDAFDHLRLTLEVPSPLDEIVDGASLSRLNAVFLFLLRLKRAAGSVRSLWRTLHATRAPPRESANVAAAHALHQMRLHVHELGHFVSALEAYFVSFVCEDGWSEMERRVAEPRRCIRDASATRIVRRPTAVRKRAE